jgi:hypothetical protein
MLHVLMQLLICVVSFSLHATSSFSLITTLYNEKNELRRAEFIQALEHNLAHELIEEICVLYDTSKDDSENLLLKYLKTKPIKVLVIAGRPTFKECFELAEQSYPHSRVIIANGDIYFNRTLQLLVPYNFERTFIALTRWDVTPQGKLVLFKDPFGVPWGASQDAWIFTTPLKKFLKADFALGTYGCDNTIAYWAYKSGLKVVNPALSVQACHLHNSNVRNYSYISPYPEHERRKVLLSYVLN